MTDRPLPPVSLVNLPNALTVLRLILVPVFLLALFAEGGHDTVWRWIAWAIFAIAAITDRYDGHIARKRGQVTDFGKIADPIADKALTGSALIGLSMLGDLTWWVTVVILVREVGVTLLRFAVLRYGVIAASPGGTPIHPLSAILPGRSSIPTCVAPPMFHAADHRAVTKPLRTHSRTSQDVHRPWRCRREISRFRRAADRRPGLPSPSNRRRQPAPRSRSRSRRSGSPPVPSPPPAANRT